MTAAVARRVTMVTPRARIDLSLPAHSPVAELLPQLVRIAGHTGSAGVAGWVLSRLDGAALPAAATPAGAGIRDGDLLYLNPAELAPEPMIFDDAVDAIASATSERRATWHPTMSRYLAAGFAAVAFAGTAVLAGAGLAWPVAPLAAGGLALALLLAGTAVARAYGDSAIGATLAAAGLPGALLAGLQATAPVVPGHVPAGAAGVGLAAVAVSAVLAALAVTDRAGWFVPVAVAGGAGGLAVAASAGFGFRPAATAAVVVLVAVLGSPLLSTLALRCGGLPRPRVPADMAAFRRDEEPTRLRAGGGSDSDAALPRATRTAARVLTGLVAGTAATVLGAAAVLLAAPERPAWGLAGGSGLVLLMRARAYIGTGPRGALLAAGTLVVLAAGVRAAAAAGPQGWPALVAALVLAGAAAVTYAVRGPQPPSPYWSRAFDIVEWLAVIGLVPLGAAVIGVFSAVRALGG